MIEFNKTMKILVITFFYLFTLNKINGQISKEGILKKYIIKDTIDEKHAVLFLYSNGTFLNFGLVNNKLEKDWYIWFTSGNYLAVSDKLLMKSNPDNYEIDQKTLSDIKKYYIWRKDYTFIANYYEYVKENYKDYPISFSANELLDESKKVRYIEDNR